jgi:hypothetical protein
MDGVVIIGSPDDEPLGDEFRGDHIAIGLLGYPARSRWVCAGCHSLMGCLVYVDHYIDGQGTGFALCERCITERLYPGPTAYRTMPGRIRQLESQVAALRERLATVGRRIASVLD